MNDRERKKRELANRLFALEVRKYEVEQELAALEMEVRALLKAIT